MDNITNETLEFLWYSYFGVSVETAEKMEKDKLMLLCAERAYLDMNRTLSFKSEERKDFRQDICSLIRKEITNKIFNTGTEKFDEVHNEICNEIIKLASDKNVLKEDFKYGQAQKWLNMALKYMWLMGFWKEQLEDLKSVLHVPVDSYIIEAVWENSEVKLPMIKSLQDGSRGAYSYEKVTSWSKWEESEYKKFQTSLRNNLKNENPIEWEGPAWIEIAETK